MLGTSASLPNENGPIPKRIEYNLPSHRPTDVAATDGHTVMIVTSNESGGETPAIG